MDPMSSTALICLQGHIQWQMFIRAVHRLQRLLYHFRFGGRLWGCLGPLTQNAQVTERVDLENIAPQFACTLPDKLPLKTWACLSQARFVIWMDDQSTENQCICLHNTSGRAPPIWMTFAPARALRRQRRAIVRLVWASISV